MVLCFDSGSLYTFIKRSFSIKDRELIELDEPERFNGLGGIFESKEVILLHVKLIKFWCRQWAYVVGDNLLERNYDVLLGHEFMQSYGIKLILPKGDR